MLKIYLYGGPLRLENTLKCYNQRGGSGESTEVDEEYPLVETTMLISSLTA